MAALNRMYYSDDYGVYKIDLEDLVGESQSQAIKFLSTTSTPALPDNGVSYINGNQIDGDNYLAITMKQAYGVKLLKNETTINPYADGYFCGEAQLNDRGILYLINKTLNRIEVYYGSHSRPGTGRTPDYIYDGYSTPSLFSNSGNTGDILTLHVVSNNSSNYSLGSRIYIGQSIGMTIIDTVDQESPDGYSANMDMTGTSISYGISGASSTYQNIGGTVPRVTDIATDEQHRIIFVVTNDGYGNGGLTQISMSTNRSIIFMNEDSGFVPSNDIRDVSKGE